jgi:hypothetical protein
VFAALIISVIEVLQNPFEENSFKDSWTIFSFRVIVGILDKR